MKSPFADWAAVAVPLHRIKGLGIPVDHFVNTRSEFADFDAALALAQSLRFNRSEPE